MHCRSASLICATCFILFILSGCETVKGTAKGAAEGMAKDYENTKENVQEVYKASKKADGWVQENLW